MPENERFWNPYRWVTVSERAVEHAAPRYRHDLSGLSGRLWCELEALTPLLVGDGRGEFVRHARNGPQYLPATSLKGAIRSLAEIVGNAAVPFPKVSVDPEHGLGNARQGSQLDIAARMFGYLHDGNVFAGLVRFSDAELAGPPPAPGPWTKYEVVVGNPIKGRAAFYPGSNRRKFYHHHVGAKRLAERHAKQTAALRPMPPGTRFRFTADFENLRDSELDLLLYCLVLEERSTVELGPAALGSDGGITLRGPLRHKLGGAKPSGAGSVHLRITRAELRTDPAARYRGRDSTAAWEGERLEDELARRTESFRKRTDRTMQELRAMLIYSADDPRNRFEYPTHDWFKRNSRVPLKPTTGVPVKPTT